MATNSIVFYLLFCVLFFFGQLQRVELYPLPAFYLHDALIFVWLLTILVKKKDEIRKRLTKIDYAKYKIELFLIFWIILGWVMAFLTGNLGTNFILYVVRFSSYSLLFYCIHYFKLLKAHYIRWGLYITGFYLLLFGLGQYAFLPDMRFLSILGWDDHLYRLVGTQFDPNFMGVLFVILFFSFKQSTLWSKSLVKKMLLFTLLVGIALTFSRSTYLSFFVGLIVTAGFTIKKYVAGLVLVILILLVPKPEGEGVDLMRRASIEARYTTSQTSVNNLLPYQFITGRGLFNTTKNNYTDNVYLRADHAQLDDNIIVLIFNSTGIIGLLLVCYLSVKYGLKLKRHDPQGFVNLMVVFTHALFNNSFFQPFVFIFLIWSLIGKRNR
jgi:hypothetical protein